MPTQSEALRLMLEAISAMREAGYTQEDVQELAGEAWDHLEGVATSPTPLVTASTAAAASSGGHPTSGPSWCVTRVPGAASPGKGGTSAAGSTPTPRDTAARPHAVPKSSSPDVYQESQAN